MSKYEDQIKAKIGVLGFTSDEFAAEEEYHDKGHFCYPYACAANCGVSVYTCDGIGAGDTIQCPGCKAVAHPSCSRFHRRKCVPFFDYCVVGSNCFFCGRIVAEMDKYSVCVCCGYHGCAECVARHQGSCQPSVNHLLDQLHPDSSKAVEDAVRHMGCAEWKREFRCIVEQNTTGDQISMLGKNHGIPMLFNQSEGNVMHKISVLTAKRRCVDLQQSYRDCYIPPNNLHSTVMYGQALSLIHI